MPQPWQNFNPNIPRSTDSPAISQADIKTNYQSIGFYVSQNHFNFNNYTSINSSDVSGKHWVVGLPPQLTSPPLIQPDTGAAYTFDSGEIGLYCFRFQNTTFELMMHTGYTTQEPEEIPITKSLLAPLPSFNLSYLPSGMIFQFGDESFANQNTTTVTFIDAFSSVCFQVFITAQTFTPSQTNIFVADKSRSGFTVDTNNGVKITGNFFWFAIGF